MEVPKPSNDQCLGTDASPSASEEFRQLAKKQRLLAQRAKLPNVRAQFNRSAERWEVLAQSIICSVARGSVLRSEFEAVSRSPSVISSGRLSIDLCSKTTEFDGAPVRLTSQEFSLLEELALSKGCLVTKDSLYDKLCCYSGFGPSDRRRPEPKIVDVFVCKLRKKLSEVSGERHLIETIRGRGYALVEPSGRNEAA